MNNRLSQETSPYLLQHQTNPIEWYAWGENAFAAARAQDKPIFLSIGYSTCHWCHVMAHESFEDPEVAAMLNGGFIAIKVDREERPDIDNFYMKALQALTGGGGWPLSAWLTPDGKPFFTGTYFPKYRFLQLLRRIQDVWKVERKSLLADGQRLTENLASALERESAGGEPEVSATEQTKFLGAYINHFQYVFDEEFGGFGSAPKFPQTMNLRLMMREDRRTGLNHAEVMVSRTLAAMVRGGMYDHLRGGFHRYSVDREWLVPHFEKMLYDQAMIIDAMLEAYLLYGRSAELRRVLVETLEYVLREMTSPEGGFFAAQDADSLNPFKDHKEEGYFATFAHKELREVLSADELQALGEVYVLNEAGDLDGRIILHLHDGVDGARQDEPKVKAARAKLEVLRAARPAPHLDDKIIAAWNGWMTAAMVRAGRGLGEARYTDAAERALLYVKQILWTNGELKRYVGAGEARGVAAAEDYVGLIHASIEMSQVSGDPQWSELARAWQQKLDQDFWDEADGGYFTGNGKDLNLPLRTKDDFDGVSPGANSLGAYNLSRLFHLTGDINLRARAQKIFKRGFAQLKRFPSGLPYFGLALDFALHHPRVIVFAGEGWPARAHAEAALALAPDRLLVLASSAWPVTKNKSGPAIYVCEEGQCQLPIIERDAFKL